MYLLSKPYKIYVNFKLKRNIQRKFKYLSLIPLIMRIIVFYLFMVLLFGIIALFVTIPQESMSLRPAHNCPPVCYTTDPHENMTQNISVQFPDINEIYAYLNATGEKKEFKSITNNSEVGTPSDFKISVVEKYQNIVWLAFIGSKNNQTDVYIQRSNDSGYYFPYTAKLSNSSAGIPSKLQLETSDDGKLVYTIWENYNPTNNKTSVWVASSLNSGKNFTSYSLNVHDDGNGYGPVLKVIDDDILIVWTQDPPMHCTGPHGLNNSGPVACSHGARW